MDDEIKALYNKKEYGQICDKIMTNYQHHFTEAENQVHKTKMAREILLHKGKMSKKDIKQFIGHWFGELHKAKNSKYNTDDLPF